MRGTWRGRLARRGVRPHESHARQLDSVSVARPTHATGGIPAEAAAEPVPDDLFDRRFYRVAYPEAGDVPRRHFARAGRAAGNLPSEGAALLLDAIRLRASVSVTPMADIVALLPESERHRAKSARFWERMRRCVHPRLYAAQLTTEELDALGGEPDVDRVVAHFLAFGAREGRRACALFNPGFYRQKLADRDVVVPDDVDLFLHWLSWGWHERIVPTPLFDEEFYAATYPKHAERWPWTFVHFVDRGCYQASVLPSPLGRHHPGLSDPDAADEQAPLLLREMLHRTEDYDLRETSWLEEGARQALARAAMLSSDRVQELLTKAAAIEPLIQLSQPLSSRIEVAPFRHPRGYLADQAERMRRALPTRVDTVVLVPHCRMGGAARVAGLLTRAIRHVDAGGSALVVTTELSAFERPDWYADDIPIFDLTPYAEGLSRDQRVDLLLDLIRGLRPKNVINVNSNLGWLTLITYGRQLSRLTSLSNYVFTYELDEHGYKTGYPIQHLQQCLGHLDHVLFDNGTLRQEIIDRYRLPATSQDRLLLARTPVDATDVDLGGAFEKRRAAGMPLRALWAGRFDRQKRFDLVVGLAEAMPDMEIWAWGKTVLDDHEVTTKDLPGNIVLKGLYADFDDLPLDEVDFMLYTSAWDGIPTVMLDAAQRGLPIVASMVGGVPEVVTERTGYPVADVDDVDAYAAAIAAMVADPAGVTARSSAMRDLIGEMFAPDRYDDVIGRIVSGEGGADERVGAN